MENLMGKLKSRLAFWVYLRRALRSLIFASRIMHPGGEIGRALRDLSQSELRPEDEIAIDLLTNAIARHQAAEENLRRWRALTPREQEVSALTCLNFTNVQIADHLTISPETVKTHIAMCSPNLSCTARMSCARISATGISVPGRRPMSSAGNAKN